MPNLRTEFCLRFILLISFVAIISALFVEHFLGHQPCNLCLIERLPYILAIIIISLGLILKKFEKAIIIFLILIFVVATIISFYHFGIEQGFFKESLVCKLNNNITNLSKDELLKQLQKETISCKDVSFRIFGLSLATINTIISLILSVITIKLFLNYEKNKQN